MLQRYQCCTSSFEEYYTQQAGNRLSYYKGVSLQKGSGLGGIFKSFYRIILPIFKSRAKTVEKQALRSAIDVSNDLMQGKEMKASAKQSAKEAAKILTEKAADKTKTMAGGNKRKRHGKKRVISKKHRKVCAPDIFTSSKNVSSTLALKRPSNLS
ncbi:hypothetical protein AVEN_250209-1 [Araneus ventricosus]|uniref:Uncharacterized protein n=1 Tax=Araneus ventricosus TaxID=182803 RepID=A0A4Y2FHI8_ARAVE|nr:hypothetical protein AVEN_250209-1 [Araneus ventricosus]